MVLQAVHTLQTYLAASPRILYYLEKVMKRRWGSRRDTSYSLVTRTFFLQTIRYLDNFVFHRPFSRFQIAEDNLVFCLKTSSQQPDMLFKKFNQCLSYIRKMKSLIKGFLVKFFPKIVNPDTGASYCMT